MDQAELNTQMTAGQPIAPQKPGGTGRRIWEFPVIRILAYPLLTGLFAVLLLLPVQGIIHLAHLHLRGQTEVIGLLNEALLSVSAVGAFFVMSRWGDAPNARASGFERQGIITETGTGLLIGAAVFSAAIGVLAASRAFQILGINHHANLWLPLALFLLVAVFEETVFRGYLFQTLEFRWGTAVALTISALLFGLAHLANPISGLTWTQRLAGPLCIVFEASILLSAAYLLTRRLWMPIGIHWGWNYFESAIYGTTDSGGAADPVHTLLHSTLVGPFWLTGGKFGPEASVVCLVVCTLTGVALLRLAIRRGQWRPMPRNLTQHIPQKNTEVIS